MLTDSLSVPPCERGGQRLDGIFEVLFLKLQKLLNCSVVFNECEELLGGVLHADAHEADVGANVRDYSQEDWAAAAGLSYMTDVELLVVVEDHDVRDGTCLEVDSALFGNARERCRECGYFPKVALQVPTGHGERPPIAIHHQSAINQAGQRKRRSLFDQPIQHLAQRIPSQIIVQAIALGIRSCHSRSSRALSLVALSALRCQVAQNVRPAVWELAFWNGERLSDDLADGAGHLIPWSRRSVKG